MGVVVCPFALIGHAAIAVTRTCPPFPAFWPCSAREHQQRPPTCLLVSAPSHSVPALPDSSGVILPSVLGSFPTADAAAASVTPKLIGSCSKDPCIPGPISLNYQHL